MLLSKDLCLFGNHQSKTTFLAWQIFQRRYIFSLSKTSIQCLYPLTVVIHYNGYYFGKIIAFDKSFVFRNLSSPEHSKL